MLRNDVPPAAQRLNRFLRMPWIPFRKIIDRLDLIDIFHFGLMSTKCLELVERTRFRVENLELEQNEKNRLIKISIEGKRSFLIIFEQFQNPRPQLKTIQLFGSAVEFLDEINVPRLRMDRKTYYFESELLRDNHYNQLVAFCTRMFKSHICLRMFFKTTMNVLNLVRSTGREIKILDFAPNNGFTARELTEILETPVSGELFVMYYEPNFQFTGILAADFVFLQDAYFLTEENLLNMQCREIVAEGTELGLGVPMALVRKWMRGGMPRLQSCVIHQSVLAFNEAPDGIPAEKWDPSMNPLEIYWNYPREGTWNREYNRQVEDASPNETWCIRGDDGRMAMMACSCSSFWFSVI